MASITVPDSVPPPSEDAEKLHKAFEGWGTDEKLIINILAHRNADQRKLIQQAYFQIYNEDLLISLQKEVTSDFERILLLWTQSPAERDAYLANEATKKLTSNMWVIMEIACARSSHDLFNVRQAYHSKYKKSLEEDVAYHTTGDYRKLLVPLITAFRYEGQEVNATMAKSEAKLLHAKIKEKAYTDEEVIRVLSTRSKAQLNATFNCYNNEFGNAINKDLKEGGDPEFMRLLRAAVKCLSYPQKYFEKVLRLSLNKLGTDENDVTRVVATRAEVDMDRIKEEFHRRNTLSLERAVQKDTGGDYERMLLALLGVAPAS